ncbi:hypothetical protein A0H76_1351 [Hepatospora eriocheir]|uniref:Exportin-1 C-terminal domain-containing protein n=1 Tax=Hepatospora eriocheir TaxID=1081669 RepID=A0A1X0Q5X5_9MICR|nr:hypothetical protein A0H76_1351 [Hepatospora eriocheir]
MLQIDLLYDLINISNNIPLLQSDKTNQTYIINYLDDLFKEAFNNVTLIIKEIFYRGLFGIKNKELFADHVKDFIVKVHEYGSDDELNEEMQLLNERMDK